VQRFDFAELVFWRLVLFIFHIYLFLLLAGEILNISMTSAEAKLLISNFFATAKDWAIN